MKNGTAAVFHSADGRVFEREHALVEAGGTREAGKVAGILLAYPGLNIEVDGYTDNAGGD